MSELKTYTIRANGETMNVGAASDSAAIRLFRKARPSVTSGEIDVPLPFGTRTATWEVSGGMMFVRGPAY